MNDKKIIYRAIADLKKLPNNPRTITKKDMDRLKKSVAENPDYFEARPIILSDRTGELVIIAGNQRYEAAKALKMDKVPTFLLSGLTEDREKEIVIRDNVANGEWDMDILADEWDAEDLRDWGVPIPDYKEIAEVDAPDVDQKETFSGLGEIYNLGKHRIFCGSFDDDEKIRELFGDKKATCTFTDPPYNVAYQSADGKKIQNDKMDDQDFHQFLSSAVLTISQNMVSGGGVIAWMSRWALLDLLSAFENNGMKMRNIITWVKSSITLGRGDFQSQSENAIYALNESAYKDIDADDGDGELGIYTRAKGGKFTKNRNLSDVWFFEKPKKSAEHPTMKPIALCAKGILAMSDPDDIVFDPFSGSGSTLIAAEQTSRICYGCEIDPKYCDVIRKRYWKLTTGSEDGWQEGTK